MSVYFRLMWKWSENLTRSFQMVWRPTQLLAVIIYIICYRKLGIIYYLDVKLQDSRVF